MQLICTKNISVQGSYIILRVTVYDYAACPCTKYVQDSLNKSILFLLIHIFCKAIGASAALSDELFLRLRLE